VVTSEGTGEIHAQQKRVHGRNVMRHAVISMPAAVDQHERRLGVVDEHLVSLLDPTSFAADQYRTIRHVVEGMHPTKKLIAVTSAVAGDGKTTTAINLAGALAHAADARILLWDLDLRTPSMEKRLGLDERTPGFADMILNPDLTLDDMIWQHPRFRLSILPAGRSPTVPYELLESPRLVELLHEARERYDYVVLDTPPLAPVPDSRVIAGHVDGVLMVVSAHKTPRKLLEDTLSILDPTKVIGIIFNNDDRPLSGYYGYYGYGYGSHHKRGRGAERRENGHGTSMLDAALGRFKNWLGRPHE
jgi:capsular exopolysaccharide synthesis family protein